VKKEKANQDYRRKIRELKRKYLGKQPVYIIGMGLQTKRMEEKC